MAANASPNEPGWPRGNRPPHRVLWELWKPGCVMRCELNEHPLGHEIRVYHRDDLQAAQVFPTERDADDRRRELLAAACATRPPMPD